MFGLIYYYYYYPRFFCGCHLCILHPRTRPRNQKAKSRRISLCSLLFLVHFGGQGVGKGRHQNVDHLRLQCWRDPALASLHLDKSDKLLQRILGLRRPLEQSLREHHFRQLINHVLEGVFCVQVVGQAQSSVRVIDIRAREGVRLIYAGKKCNPGNSLSKALPSHAHLRPRSWPSSFD